MNAKKAKQARFLVRVIFKVTRITATYQWVRRPDGSVFRQLGICPRAMYQSTKGKGFNRVQPSPAN